MGIRQAVEQGAEPAVEGALDCLLKVGNSVFHSSLVQFVL